MIKLFDTKIDINFRLFLILAWTSVIANSAGFISNLIFYGVEADTCFYGVCAVTMMVITYVGNRNKKATLMAGIILVILNAVEFPLMYYLYGSGRIVYMVLGIIGIMIFVKKRRRVIFSSLSICFDVFVMIISVIFPSNYVDITPENDLGAAIVSFLIVVISTILVLVLIVKQYETQNQKLIDITGELKNMAERDPLTQLYNRRYLTDYLEPMMTGDKAFSVVLMDLDDFKSVNDKYGHIYGDEVLKNFAACIKKAGEDLGIAARFGGEEFMLVLNTSDRKKIENVMANIKCEFEKFTMKSKGIRITFSGGAEICHNELRITSLFNAADEKLYMAKGRGKNQVVYDAEKR